MRATSLANQPSRTGIWRRARDRFLLEDVEREVSSRRPEQQDVVARYHRAAALRAEAADDLFGARSSASSMILYRDAVRLFIAAAVTAHDGSADPRAVLADENSPWEALATLSRRAVIAEPPREVQAAREILGAAEHEPLVFDESAPEKLLAQRTVVEGAVTWLRGLVEPRTLTRIRAERILRLSVLGTIGVAALALVAYGLLRPTNLALHKPVTISSRLPGSVAPEDNSGLVNGQIEANYGIHTNRGGGWVTVDLQDIDRLSRIAIFNRSDAWFDESLPMRLALSQDGQQWKEVERRATSFTASDPWIFEAHGERARFVRVSSDKYVALTEIEIFGTR